MPGLPNAVYLETSVLQAAAHRTDDPALQTLSRICAALKRPLLTARLVIDELAQGLTRELQQAVTNLDSSRRDFERRRLPAPTVTWPTAPEDIMRQLPQWVQDNLTSYGIGILDNLRVDQERLLAMAVRKDPPFTLKGEKGFRDAVILITMLQHCRDHGWKQILVVTNDGAISDACGTLPEAEGIEISVAQSIELAGDQIDVFVGAAVRRWEERRKAACKQFLIEQRARIEDYVKSAVAFTEDSFRNLEPGEIVQETHVLRLVDLEVSALGELPRGQNEGTVRFSAAAGIDVDATISRSRWPLQKQFRVGQPPEDPTTALLMGQIAFVKPLRAVIMVEGLVRVREAGGREQFSDLVLDGAGTLPPLPRLPQPGG